MGQHERLVDIVTPALRKVRPDAELRQARGVREAITEGGEVKPIALRTALPWQSRDFWVPGPVPFGPDAAQRFRVRQAMRLRYLDAIAKVGPSSGKLVAVVEIHGGEALGSVTIEPGSIEGTQSSNALIPAGSVISLRIASGAGAADLTVTTWLAPDTR